MSDELTVYDHLSSVQTLLKAPKNEENPQQRWHYRTVEGILEAFKLVKPDGCYVFMSDDTHVEDGWHYIVTTITFGFKGQHICVTGRAREPLEERSKSGALMKLPQQVTASTSTFARKIALCGLFAIDNSDTQDIDKSDQSDIYDAKNPPKQVAKPVLATLAEVNELSGLMVKLNYDESKLLQRYGVRLLLDLTRDQYLNALAGLSKLLSDRECAKA